MKLDIKTFVDNESEKIASEIREFLEDHQQTPRHIVFVRVGDDPASVSYMKAKSNYLKKLNLGLVYRNIVLDYDQSSSATERAVSNLTAMYLDDIVQDLNDDGKILGYLIQLPVPGLTQEDTNSVLYNINYHKDIDSLCGSFEQYNSNDIYNYPCTPLGILYYLQKNNIDLNGKRVTILGRSNVVGKPLALACINNGATVTVMNSKTPQEVRDKIFENSDIIISAIGKPKEIKIPQHIIDVPEYLDHKVLFFDVGINRIEDPNAKNGTRLVGDLDTESYEIPGNIDYTPVPGGVGLLTRLGLLLRIRELIYN